MAMDGKTAEPKKTNIFTRFIVGAAATFFIPLLALVLWCAVSACHRQAPLKMLPAGYSMYIRMDSLRQAIDPLLDLRAADILFSSPEFSTFRAPFMNLRASSLRRNKLVTRLAARRADIALYGSSNNTQDFLALIDLGALSAVTRPAQWYAAALNLPGLSYSNAASCFEYRQNNSVFYIKPYRNLLIITQSATLLAASLSADNDEAYSSSERSILNAKSGQPIKVVVNAQQLASSITAEEPTLSKMLPLLSKDTLSVLSFGISDAEISVNAAAPLSLPDESHNALAALIKRNSSIPSSLAKMSGIVNYYTIINAGSVEELKQALFPFFPKSADADAAWAKGNAACKTLFSLSLEDVIFSWTGSEFAVMGIEGRTAPVFAVQIKDEKQRQRIFSKLISSILLQDDTSLILDGVRIPRIAIPQAVQNVLALFGIALPSPYYTIRGGFIYFSESAENLAALSASINAGKRIAKNPNWQTVSAQQNPECAVSLFYDLAHSLPFFLRGNAVFSRILKLYTLGRCDMRIKNSTLTLQLHAVSRSVGDLRAVPGFPISLAAPASPELQTEPGKKAGSVFWTEGGTTVKSLELSGMQTAAFESNDSCAIVSAGTPSKNGGVLWALTAEGAVYLLNRQLQAEAPFPILTGEQPAAEPSAAENYVVFPTKGGALCFVYFDGAVKTALLPDAPIVRSAATALGKTAAVYVKGFEGAIYLFDDARCTNADAPLAVSGIGFGSPALLKKDGALFVAFITQAGNLSIWKDGALLAGFPQKLDGVFYANAVAGSHCFFAVSAAGRLYKIELDGAHCAIDIPNGAVKNGFITVRNPDSSALSSVFVNTDGNVLYGFSSGLELLAGFPLAGWGRPVFADVNADHFADCFALTIDQKLNAWNLR